MMTKKMITAVIVDDDAAAVKKLHADLVAFPDITVAGTAVSVETAKRLIIREQPDLLFLDVEMPEMSGFELLNEIQSQLHADIKIVFHTAYNKYLLDAIRASAFDYLLKPYMPEELAAIIERYRSRTPKDPMGIEQSLRKLLARDAGFAIQTLSGLMPVNPEKVIMFQFVKELRCWQMMLADRKLHKLRTGATARELTALDRSFVQIAQDCIVNIRYLASIENKTLRCMFCPPYSDMECTASQRYFKKIKEMMDII